MSQIGELHAIELRHYAAATCPACGHRTVRHASYLIVEVTEPGRAEPAAVAMATVCGRCGNRDIDPPDVDEE